MGKDGAIRNLIVGKHVCLVRLVETKLSSCTEAKIKNGGVNGKWNGLMFKGLMVLGV